MPFAFPLPERTCFWTGAGVSADFPAALPLGDELTRVIVSEICGPEVWVEAREEFRIAAMSSASGRAKTAPRLEWVTEHLWRAVGDQAINGFKAFVGAPPNDLHRFFASHLAAGGRHLTLNFDRCIETALGAQPGVGPVHLHGALGENGLGDLRTRTLDLTGGLRGPDRAAVSATLRDSRLLVFLGYSGRDYFDVDPFFRALERSRSSRLDRLRVLWLEHDERRPGFEVLDWHRAAVADGKPILEALDRLGASVEYVQGPTRLLLAEAAGAWGMAAPVTAPDPRSAAARAESLRRVADQIAVAYSESVRATGVFWFSMGANRRIVELDERLAGGDRVDRGLREAITDLSRAGRQGLGLYRQSARLARRIEDPVRRHDSLSSAYRLRGSAGRSLWHLLRAFRFCASPASSDPGYAAHCGDVREGYVAWYRAARTSSLGPAVGFARRAAVGLARLVGRDDPWFDPVLVFRQFRDCEPYVVSHPHAVEQIGRAWREVPEFRADGPLPASILDRQADRGAVYVETDHFLGHLNSERNRLAGALAGRVGGERPTAAELARHRRQAEEQADLPGELKAVLLERVAKLPASPFPWRALARVEWNARAKLFWVLRWARRAWPRR